MKTKMILMAAAAGLFFMTSCSHGPSEEAKKKVAAFDSTWTAMGTSAMAWGDSLNQMVTMCEGCCKEGEAMECCEHMKADKDSMLMPCMNDMKAFQEMKSSWDAEMPMWDSLQAKLDALKEGVAKGTSSDDQINSTLAELQAAADKGSAQMGPWIDNFKAAKAKCMENCSSCKDGMSNMNCSDKKCSHHKAEKKS
jgi:hypothetical protein